MIWSIWQSSSWLVEMLLVYEYFILLCLKKKLFKLAQSIKLANTKLANTHFKIYTNIYIYIVSMPHAEDIQIFQ